MRHTLSETWSGLRRNASMTLAVVVTMWVSLTLFGAGLLVGKSLIVASDRPRLECLVEAARQSLRLFGGVIPMLIVAGLIEGFVSPTGLAPAAKFTIGASMATLLALYLGWAGRTRPVPATASTGRSAP